MPGSPSPPRPDADADAAAADADAAATGADAAASRADHDAATAVAPDPAPGRLRAAWLHVRALLILGHVVAVIALAFPPPHKVLNRRGWESENARAEVERWRRRLNELGVHITATELKDRAWAVAQRYAAAHRAVLGPFERYARWSGAMQGWAMFANPQKHPGELHVDVMVDGAWQPVYRPHSEQYDFWAESLEHNRLRKQLGRFARTFYPHSYNGLARFLAVRAARAYPAATQVMVRLYRYPSRSPEEVRAGRAPAGYYQHELGFDAAALRREPAP
ncbi:hypothetical protein [Haliangium sp.]|uniref:hypothetical protein n=1 Tax=Haliangium sp. TaxID=2663208 RepID=UPI003D099F92